MNASAPSPSFAGRITLVPGASQNLDRAATGFNGVWAPLDRLAASEWNSTASIKLRRTLPPHRS